MVRNSIQATTNTNEREQLVALETELQELISLTKESLDAHSNKEIPKPEAENDTGSQELDDEYALFMVSIKST